MSSFNARGTCKMVAFLFCYRITNIVTIQKLSCPFDAISFCISKAPYFSIQYHLAATQYISLKSIAHHPLKLRDPWYMSTIYRAHIVGLLGSTPQGDFFTSFNFLHNKHPIAFAGWSITLIGSAILLASPARCRQTQSIATS